MPSRDLVPALVGAALAIGCGRIAAPDDPSANDAIADTISDTGPDVLVDVGGEVERDTATGADSVVTIGETSSDTMPIDAGSETGTADACTGTCCGTVDDLHVDPSGSDVTGNGSEACPYKTITHAIEASAHIPTSRTITLTSGGYRYGDACSGGPPCDVTPIVVPKTIGHPLTIRGVPGLSVEIGGGGDSVLRVEGEGVGFANLQLRPTKLDTLGHGGHGIVYGATASADQGPVDHVSIEGVRATAADPGTGYGIWFMPGGHASPPIVSAWIKGGWAGIVVEGSSHPRLTGDSMSSTGDIVWLSDMGLACVWVHGRGTDAAAIDTTSMRYDVMLERCGTSAMIVDGTNAATSHIDGVYVSDGQDGIQVMGGHHAVLSNVLVEKITGDGVDASEGCTVDVDHVAVNDVGNDGVAIVGSKLNARSLSVLRAGGDGIVCDGGLVMLRDSRLLQNTGNGLQVRNRCVADLGTTTDPGNGVFNMTTQRNGLAGICFSATSAPELITHAVFSCDHRSMLCTSGKSPTVGLSSACVAGVDLSHDTTVKVDVTDATCCE